jgi:hypothetical protein
VGYRRVPGRLRSQVQPRRPAHSRTRTLSRTNAEDFQREGAKAQRTGRFGDFGWQA